MRTLRQLSFLETAAISTTWPVINSPAVAQIRNFYIQIQRDCYYHGYTYGVASEAAGAYGIVNFMAVVNPIGAPLNSNLTRRFAQDSDILFLAKSGSNNENQVQPHGIALCDTRLLSRAYRRKLPMGTIVLAMLGAEPGGGSIQCVASAAIFVDENMNN